MFLVFWNYIVVPFVYIGAVVVIGGTLLVLFIDFCGWIRQKRKRSKK